MLEELKNKNDEMIKISPHVLWITRKKKEIKIK
jgi:hypothetical protein